MYRVVLLLSFARLVSATAPFNPQEVLKEAVAAQQSGDLNKAVADYRLLIDKYPNVPEIHSNLGTALSAQGKYAEAVAEYQTALKIKPNPQVRMNLGLAFYKLGKTTLALDAFTAVRNVNPANMQAVTLIADCYLRLGQNKQVIDLLTPIQRATPDNRAFDYMLGMALLRDGQVNRAKTLIDRILRDGDSAESRLLMGTTKFMNSDFAGARDDFAKAVELNPDLPDLFSYYGLALLSTGDQDAARKAFVRELQANPNDFESNLHLGVLLRHDEEYEQALAYLNHALEIRPGDPGARYQIATIEVARNQLDAACRDLEGLIKDSPDFIEAHVSLATVYFRQKRKTDGERERAIYARLNAERQAKTEVAAKPPAQ
jgi:tetratricopeptide (TPR) repeat protein